MTNSRFLPILAGHHAAGMSIRDAAKAANCSEKTAYTLAGTAEFKSRVSEIRTQFTAEAVGKLTSAATEAVDTLRSLLEATNEPSVRLNAAKAILANLGPLAELHELRARIDRIESQGTMLRVAR